MDCVKVKSQILNVTKITSQRVCSTLTYIMTFSHQSCNCLSNFRSLQDAEYIWFLALSQQYLPSSLNQNYLIRVGKYILEEGEWKKFEITYIITNLCTDYLEKKLPWCSIIISQFNRIQQLYWSCWTFHLVHKYFHKQKIMEK